MSEMLNLSTEPEQTLSPAENNVESDSTTSETNVKPTALNRLSNLLLQMAIKVDSADTSFNNFKAETS